MQALAEAISSSRSIATLDLSTNDLGQKHARAVCTMLATAQLRECKMGDEDRRAAAGARLLGPFAHEPNTWVPGILLRRQAFVMALLDGLWPVFSPRVLTSRAVWTGLCVAAALLPRAYADITAAAAGAPTSASASITRAFTTGALRDQCHDVPAVLDHAYIDAVSGFVLAVALASGKLVQEVAFKLLSRVMASCNFLVQRAEAIAEDQQADDEVLRRVTEKLRARDHAFLLLIQVLCGCNSLGNYFSTAPTGGPLCTLAHAGLAIFYKPLVFPLWYCLFSLLDTSGVKLKHYSMTQTLCWVVQMILLLWAIACGVLSLPLLVVFPMFGLLFAVPPLLFGWLKRKKLALAKHRFSGAQERANDYDAWNSTWKELTEAQQAEHLATEQLLCRLQGYSCFAALVFGIRLWRFYQTGDWAGTLSDAGGALGVSMPVWDLPTLALSFSWPKELSLPAQLPLFVSLGFIGVEKLLWLWGHAHEHAALSTRDEMRQRLREHPASGGGGSAGEAEERDLELGELAVSNPASAPAGRAQAASDTGAERAVSSGARLGSSATISVSL